MPYKVAMNVRQPDAQSAIIPDATNNSVGVISLNKVREIASASGGIAFKRVVQEQAQLGGNTFPASAGDLMVINGGGADGSSVTIPLPSAAVAAMVGVKNYAQTNTLRVSPEFGDTVEGNTGNFNIPLNVRTCAVFVSDGVSNWVLVSLFVPGD
ncbi:MAG TPA: hypothetical protein VFI56_09160 [Vicinamibacterales bacterium]|nr:hypothetical protein [Vicinamibacterales bacterium]